jgi:hypothetical protein
MSPLVTAHSPALSMMAMLKIYDKTKSSNAPVLAVSPTEEPGIDVSSYQAVV